MKPPRWLVLGGFTAVVGAWLAAPAPASGQGVPTWAVHVAERPDAGPSASASGTSSGGVVHGRTAYRRDGGAGAPLDKDRFLVEPLEFFLGFNPLERSPEELARRQDGGPKPDKPTRQDAPAAGVDGGPSVGPADAG